MLIATAVALLATGGGLAAVLRAQPVSAAASGDNPAQIALGKRLFSDVGLSRDGKVSCASCHDAKLAFTDGKPVSTGFEGKAGTRNAMSLLNVGHQPHFFWDGRRTRLEEQVLDPLLNPLEHAFGNPQQVLAVLRAKQGYMPAFAQAFPAGAAADPITTEHLAVALASFVRSLTSPESAIDRFVVRHEPAALSAEARAGFEVFSGKGQCSTCHSLTPDRTTGRVLLTDQDFHAHSATFYGMHQALDQAARSMLTQGKPLAQAAQEEPQSADALGRFMITGQLADVGAFRTPSLRNVARTAPYFHDGGIATLELAMEQELLSQGSEQIPLEPDEKRALLAFLRSLDDDK